MSRLRLFGYYLPSLLSVVGRFYRLVAYKDTENFWNSGMKGMKMR